MWDIWLCSKLPSALSIHSKISLSPLSSGYPLNWKPNTVKKMTLQVILKMYSKIILTCFNPGRGRVMKLHEFLLEEEQGKKQYHILGTTKFLKDVILSWLVDMTVEVMEYVSMKRMMCGSMFVESWKWEKQIYFWE